MTNILASLANIFWERNTAGDSWYTELSESDRFGLTGTNLEISQNHPILTPALLFVSKLFAEAQFYMVNVKNGEKSFKHPVLEMLNNPNYYQTRVDLLESLMFMQISNGCAVLYKKTIPGMDETTAVYLLDYNKITWPEGFKTTLNIKNKDNPVKDVFVTYDKDGDSLKIKIDDLYFFYDMPGAMNSKNLYKCKSRLDGLRQTLINTADSLVAKNIILKTNGKELISGSKEGFPLSDDEKHEAQKMLNNRYGLSSTRSRSLITKANVTWKSLHIAIRDLGLDESVKVDGNIIYTALHIPKDILSLESKKTTYNNFKESMTSFIQNNMQSSLNAFCEVINTASSDKVWKLSGDYDNLPVMQFIKKERYEAEKIRGEALTALTSAGIPGDVALKLLGFDPRIQLVKPETATTEEPATTSSAKALLQVAI